MINIADGGKKKEKKIIAEIGATNVIASQLPVTPKLVPINKS